MLIPARSLAEGPLPGKNLVVTITESEFIRMKSAVMDKDGEEAVRLLKELLKRLEKQENLGLKSHLVLCPRNILQKFIPIIPPSHQGRGQ